MKAKYIWVGVGWLMVLVGLVFFIRNDGSGTQAEIDWMSDPNNRVKKVSMNNTINTNKTMDTNVTELKIEDEVVGTGEEAKAGDSVTVHYMGTLTDGTMFDASRSHGNDGFTFALGRGQVIKGWDVGVAGMKVGGKRRLIIPSDMAYGSQAVGGVIPANSTLIFEVELLKVTR